VGANPSRSTTNRAVVELATVQAVAGAESLDLTLDLPLLGLAPGELRLSRSERAQVLGNERADRGPTLGGADPRGAVDVVGTVTVMFFTVEENHSFTVSVRAAWDLPCGEPVAAGARLRR
jgi:hypothetical protein